MIPRSLVWTLSVNWYILLASHFAVQISIVFELIMVYRLTICRLFQIRFDTWLTRMWTTFHMYCLTLKTRRSRFRHHHFAQMYCLNNHVCIGLNIINVKQIEVNPLACINELAIWNKKNVLPKKTQYDVNGHYFFKNDHWRNLAFSLNIWYPRKK